MAGFPIQPNNVKPSSVAYHHLQKLSWKIKKEHWNESEVLNLQLKTEIPQAYRVTNPGKGWTNPYTGGYIKFSKTEVSFVTHWPKDIKPETIHLEANFRIRSNDGGISVDIRSGERASAMENNYNYCGLKQDVKVDLEHFYDEDSSFTFEADILIELNNPMRDYLKKYDSLVKTMDVIYNDVSNADISIFAENKKFMCHKIVLSATSDVFKNMIACDTQEKKSNLIDIKEVPAKAVEDMLKYIYTGNFPDDVEDMSLELLNIAEKYHIDSLKEACLKKLSENLDVSSCISNFILVDRYMPGGGDIRDKVITFMKCKAEEVVEMEDWDKLVENYPVLAKELMRALVKGIKKKHTCQYCLVSYN